jgi:hypothetical protein
MTTWNDPPEERDPHAPGPPPFLTRLFEAILIPREPDPDLDHYGPSDRPGGAGGQVVSAPRSDPDRDREPQKPSASHREPRAYVTEISVPYFGDGGVQRLHARMKDADPEPADLSDAGIEAG